MYRCDACQRQSDPGEPSFRVVLETREVQYDQGEGVEPTHGTEIVREAVVCEFCSGWSREGSA